MWPPVRVQDGVQRRRLHDGVRAAAVTGASAPQGDKYACLTSNGFQGTNKAVQDVGCSTMNTGLSIDWSLCLGCADVPVVRCLGGPHNLSEVWSTKFLFGF